jgi:hypothetical protein
VRVVKDGSCAADRDLALIPVRTNYMLAQHAVEVDAKLLRDCIEVVQICVGSIVLHDHQHASRLDPLRNLRRVFRRCIMRVRILDRDVR